MNDLLDAVRRSRDLTRDAHIAQATGIEHTYISKWRKGKGLPSDANVVKLALFGGLDVTYWLLRLNEARSEGIERDYYAKAAKARASDLSKSDILGKQAA